MSGIVPQTVLQQFVSDAWLALAGWLVLIIISAASLAIIVAGGRERRAVPVSRVRRGTRKSVAPRITRMHRLQDAATDLKRSADEIAVAADRAALTAAHRRTEWQSAQRIQDAAWRAFRAADEATDNALRAAAFPTTTGAAGDYEMADRRRHLYRAATRAYRRGDLRIDQLQMILTERGGWDPRRHPVELELALRQLGRERLCRAYTEASAVERAAWQSAEIARMAKLSLAKEALAAAVQAQIAQSTLASARATLLQRLWAIPIPAGPTRTQAAIAGIDTITLPRRPAATDTVPLPVLAG